MAKHDEEVCCTRCGEPLLLWDHILDCWIYQHSTYGRNVLSKDDKIECPVCKEFTTAVPSGRMSCPT